MSLPSELPYGNAIGWAEVRRMILARDSHQCVGCQEPLTSRDADIHHLLPRAMGGTDEPANLITLCDGCHAAHHPNLSGGLARRAMERWAVWLAHFFDPHRTIDPSTSYLGPALRLLGVQRFREGQLPVVEAALAGKSVLVVRPTGSGKTLCFQMPAIMRPGVTVVISPLKALMAEQVSTLLRKKVPATFVNSDLNFDEKKLRYTLLRRGAIKLLHIAPERFYVRSDSERARLAELRPAYLVVDEAHCVDQWGQDFRPEYGRIKDIRAILGNPPVLAFTATAGVEMQGRIKASLGIDDAEVFVSGVDRPNIALYRWEVHPDRRASTIAELASFALPPGDKMIVFVPSAKVGEDLQLALQALKIQMPLYHSKFGTPFLREQLIKRFTDQSQPPIDRMITTSAFGMGLDISAVRLVVHWQHPASVEDLLQELGRAGRDGRQSAAVIFHEGGAGSKDVGRLRFMAEKSVDEADVSDNGPLQARYKQIARVADAMTTQGCFRKQLVAYFEGNTRRPQSFALRILEWLFSTPVRQAKSAFCCDFCDRPWQTSAMEHLRRATAG